MNLSTMFIEKYQEQSVLNYDKSPVISSHYLTNSFKYVKINHTILNNLFSEYLAYEYKKYATCYQLRHTSEEIKELNDLISVSIYNGKKDLNEIIYNYILKYEYKLTDLLILFNENTPKEIEKETLLQSIFKYLKRIFNV